MAKKEPAAIRRHVGTLFRIGTTGAMTDGQLLKRFVLRDGEPADLAFAALVERHGPMVLRVCRALLRDEHEAQDAVQATFLILVLRADSIRKRESAASWLHGVARRVASCARAASARRRVHERRAAERTESWVDARTWDDLGEVLHEELARLPLPYREALVVCDLEGLSEGQAAERLDWPIGTVRSRLARGRDRLRRRLVRRGLAPAVGLIAAVSTPGIASAAMPGVLVEATLQAARGLALGSLSGSVVSSSVEVLTRKVLKNMQLAQWKIPAALAFGFGAFTTVAACLAARPGTDEPSQDEPPAAASKPAPARADDAPGNVGALKSVVEARGMLQPSHTTDVVNEVEGMTTILSIVPEGTLVKKGQVVCKLDSASLKDELFVQVLAEKEAVSAYENAKLAHEVAEIALAEYAEGISKRELDAVHGEIAGSKLAIQKAEERLERTRRARQRLNDMLAPKGESRTPADLLAELDVDDRISAAELTLDRERRLLEKAVSDHAVIEKYTRPKTIKALSVEVEKRRSIESTRDQARQLAGSRREKLAKQIEKCTILAPSDGVVRYPPYRQMNNRNTQMIEEGATLRERQKILSVLDMSEPLYVVIEVPESAIARVKPGQKARIKPDAFPDETLKGVVKLVAPLVSPGTTIYLTRILIDHGSPNLRPNMTASVEILVDEPEETPKTQAPDAPAPKSSDPTEKPERR